MQTLICLQQKGTFETGQEDSTTIPEDLRIRLAYREAAVAVVACYYPDPYRPFIQASGEVKFIVSNVPFLLFLNFRGSHI